jgi:hypothetical protein
VVIENFEYPIFYFQAPPSQPVINETIILYNSTTIKWLVDDYGDSILKKVFVEATNLNEWPNMDSIEDKQQIYSAEGMLLNLNKTIITILTQKSLKI